jgi:hypothetical protein
MQEKEGSTNMSPKSVQATPTNIAVLSLSLQTGSCHRYGVPDLGLSAESPGTNA